jgi:hypothetical protein
MIFKTITGSTKRLPKAKRYIIDWGGKSRSKLQFGVKEFLLPYWSGDVVFEEFPVVGTKLTLDFYNANKKIAVEVQGAQHLKYTPFFHGASKSTFLGQIRRDDMKQSFCELNKIILVEIYPKDILSEELFKSFGAIL